VHPTRALALALATMLVAALAPAAQALETPLEFSRDGSTWAAAPPDAVFETGPVLVPGGSATAVLHVRSTAQSDGVLSASLATIGAPDDEAARRLGVTGSVTARSAGHGAVTGVPDDGHDGAEAHLPRTSLAELETPAPLDRELRLAPGQSATILLSIDLAAETSGTRAQDTSVDVALGLTFRDARSGGAEGDGDGGGDGEGAHGGAPDGGAAGGSHGGVGGGEQAGAADGSGRGAAATGSDTTSTIPLIPSADGAPVPSDQESLTGGASSGSTTGGTSSSETPATAASPSGPLAITGASVRPVLLLAAGLLVGGLLLLSRRRKGES
jgi:hypothetical protein